MARYNPDSKTTTTDTLTGVFQLEEDDLVTLRDNGYPGVDHLRVDGSSWYFQDLVSKRFHGPYEDPNEALDAYEAHLQGKTP